MYGKNRRQTRLSPVHLRNDSLAALRKPPLVVKDNAHTPELGRAFHWSAISVVEYDPAFDPDPFRSEHADVVVFGTDIGTDQEDYDCAFQGFFIGFDNKGFNGTVGVWWVAERHFEANAFSIPFSF